LLCSGFVPIQCGTVEICVVFLDTLTPVFELYVRLRERRQWDSDFPEFVLLSLSRFDSFEVCPGVGTVVTAVVVCGVPEWWHSFGYGWYLYPVVWCDLSLNVLYPSSGKLPYMVFVCDGLPVVANPAILCVAFDILWFGYKGP
ncbi:hypothetical protein Taro_045584, partial [Colocasia esculenta]|nr:hypothetical protein [Colocasia esculenta]